MLHPPAAFASRLRHEPVEVDRIKHFILTPTGHDVDQVGGTGDGVFEEEANVKQIKSRSSLPMSAYEVCKSVFKGVCAVIVGMTITRERMHHK